MNQHGWRNSMKIGGAADQCTGDFYQPGNLRNFEGNYFQHWIDRMKNFPITDPREREKFASGEKRTALNLEEIHFPPMIQTTKSNSSRILSCPEQLGFQFTDFSWLPVSHQSIFYFGSNSRQMHNLNSAILC